MNWLSVILLASLFTIDPSKVSKTNKLKSEARQAYLTGDMKTAIQKYRFLIDSLHVTEEEVTMNLANAYFNTNDTTSAINQYQPLSVSVNPKIRSWANQQMGVVTNRQGKAEEALNYFKQALKAEPGNDQARYNYEMVKKKLEEKKKQNQKNQQDQKNRDMEPSAYAKRMKAEADRLVSKQEYKGAYDLMAEALKKDQTVAHYQEFINRTKNVSGIK